MIRTPNSKDSDKPSPKRTTTVRSSIEGWEAAQADPTPTQTTQAGMAKTRTRLALSQDSATTRRTSIEASPPKQKRADRDRVAEAKNWLSKAKLNLNASRNLKAEIKLAIQESLDRLFAIVKEAEAEGKTRKENVAEKPEPRTEAGAIDSAIPAIPDTKWQAQLEEHTKLLSESNKRMAELKDIMDRQQETMERAATYAAVAATQNRKSQPQRQTLHSVVVTSKNEEESGEEVLDKVRKAADAKEGWVTVERVRKAKDRKIIMGFGTREERDKMRERLGKEAVDLTVEEVKNRDPLLILKGVLVVNTDEDVLKAMRNQNRSLFHGLGGEEDRLEIKYRRRTRNPHIGHIVISASPTIWRRAVDAGEVRIDLQRIRVEDQSPLVQCTRCLGYGHGRRFCKEPADLCSHCGGPHMRTECQDWRADVPPCCKNCSRAKLDKTEHNAFSMECPTRRKWDELARQTVAYC